MPASLLATLSHTFAKSRAPWHSLAPTDQLWKPLNVCHLTIQPRSWACWSCKNSLPCHSSCWTSCPKRWIWPPDLKLLYSLANNRRFTATSTAAIAASSSWGCCLFNWQTYSDSSRLAEPVACIVAMPSLSLRRSTWLGDFDALENVIGLKTGRADISTCLKIQI